MINVMNCHFKPIIERASNIMPLSIVVADKVYDSEYNHELVREHLNALSIILARKKEGHEYFKKLWENLVCRIIIQKIVFDLQNKILITITMQYHA